MLDEYLKSLDEEEKEKTASQARFGAASVQELAKLAGIKLAEDVCSNCGGKMEKTGSIYKCGCGMMKKAAASCPGGKIRSKGMGRGRGYGKKKGPMGVPVGEKAGASGKQYAQDLQKLKKPGMSMGDAVKAYNKKYKKKTANIGAGLIGAGMGAGLGAAGAGEGNRGKGALLGGLTGGALGAAGQGLMLRSGAGKRAKESVVKYLTSPTVENLAMMNHMNRKLVPAQLAGIAATGGAAYGAGRLAKEGAAAVKLSSALGNPEFIDKLAELIELNDGDLVKTASVLEQHGMSKEAFLSALKALGTTAKGAVQVGRQQGLKAGLKAGGRGLKWTGHQAAQSAKALPGKAQAFGQKIKSQFGEGAGQWGSAGRSGGRAWEPGLRGRETLDVMSGLKNVVKQNPALVAGGAAGAAGLGAGYAMGKQGSALVEVGDAAGRLFAKTAALPTLADYPEGSLGRKMLEAGPGDAALVSGAVGAPIGAGVGLHHARGLPGKQKALLALLGAGGVGLGAAAGGALGNVAGTAIGKKINPKLHAELAAAREKTAQAPSLTSAPIPLDEIRESIQEAQAREDVPGRAKRWQIGGGVGGGLLGGGAGYGAGRLIGGQKAGLIGAGLGAAGGAFGGQALGKEHGAEEARADKAVAMLRALRAHQAGAMSGYGAGMQRGYAMGRGPQGGDQG